LKKALTCFAILLLLLTVFLISTPKNALSKTEDVKILSYTHYIDNAGYLDVIGEIQNTGSDTIYEVVLKATIYGADGTEQGSITNRAWVSYLVPNQKAPFLLDIQAPTGYSDWYTAGVSKITISVSIANAVNSHLYSDFTTSVTSAAVSSSADDKGTYWISGVIRNIGSQTATQLALTAIFYNSSGSVVAVGHTDYLTPTSVSPSTTASFKVGAFDTNQTSEVSSRKIASYSLNVQATTPVLDGSGSTSTSQPSSATPTATSNQQTDISGTSSPISSQNLIYVLIIVGIVIAAVAVLLVSRRRKSAETEVEVKKKTITNGK
jgi:hypothetical protein